MRKVVVYHTGYGCDTGCCGHVIEVDGQELRNSFTFDHPSAMEDAIEWAKDFVRGEMGEEHVADLDWEQSELSDY